MPRARRGTEVTFLPSTQTFTMTEFDFATLEHRLRELAFLNSGVSIVLTDMRHAVEKREEMRYEGGVEAFVRYLDRNKKPLVPAPIMIKAERDGITVEGAMSVERQLPRERALLHQQHPAARRRHASGRLPRRADAAGHRLCREQRHRAQGKGRADRRRLPRRPDLRAVGARCRIRNSPRRPRTSWSPPKCGRWSRASSTRRWRTGSRSIPPKRRSSSARWSKPPPRARRRARRAN